MLIGGVLQLVVGLATGEADRWFRSSLSRSSRCSPNLVVVPSLIGFPLLRWLLSEVPVHIANTASRRARTAWHTHPNGQTIYVTGGVGLAQRRGARSR
jgi:hypothetical protein